MQLALACFSVFGLVAPTLAQGPFVQRVDAANQTTPPNGIGILPTISSDGDWVTFQSNSTNLLPGAVLGAFTTELYAKQLSTGVIQQVNLNNAGGRMEMLIGGFGGQEPVSTSSRAREIAFATIDPDPLSNDVDPWADIYVRDRIAGTTEWISSVDPTPGLDAECRSPSISDDGRYVIYLTQGSFGALINDSFDTLALRDRVAQTTTFIAQVSVASSADRLGLFPVISGDGKTVVYSSSAAGPSGWQGLVRYDVQSGQTTPLAGLQLELSDHPQISLSKNGRYVAFETSAALFFGDNDLASDIYVVDLLTGTILCVSVCVPPVGLISTARTPSLSPEGRYVAFNVRGADWTSWTGSTTEEQVMLLDLSNGLFTLGSINDQAQPAASSAFANFARIESPRSLSAKGNHLVMRSTGTNLALPLSDPIVALPEGIFVRDRQTDGPTLSFTNLMTGQIGKAQVAGATPGGLVWLGLSLTGQGPVGSPWGVVDLSAPYLLTPLVAGGGGVAELSVPLTPAFTGLTLWGQALDVVGAHLTTTAFETVQ